MDYVLGFTCTNDVTLRDLQKLDPMWTRAKGFDTACPLARGSRPSSDWRDARISFSLNGEDVPEASGTTANLIHGIPEQIAAISSYATLLPGDVILTGTPHASGSLKRAMRRLCMWKASARCGMWWFRAELQFALLRGFNSEGLIFLAREFQRRGSATTGWLFSFNLLAFL